MKMKREKNRNKIAIFTNGQNVGNIPSFLKWIIVFLCFAFFFLLTKPTFGAGVTIVTHGFVRKAPLTDNCDTGNDWVNQMGDAVATQAGSHTAVYNMHINFHYTGDLYVESFDFERGDIPSFSLNPNSEVVIKLYWDKVANNVLFPYASTTAIANTVVPYLTKWNAGPGLVKPLVEMPIHLIGHSRGGSVVSEMSKLLAASGIWVDQVTTLDPHPIKYKIPSDSSVSIYDNVVFADNYFRTQGGDCPWVPDIYLLGDYVDGANNKNLYDQFSKTNLIETCYHSLVHYWYHGTIDSSELLKLDCDTITKDIRDIWYTSNDFGYKLSRIANGQTLRGTTGPKNGLKWANANRSDKYTRWESDIQWPNVELENIDDKWIVKVGDTVQIRYRYQDYGIRGIKTTFDIGLVTDTDRNPYNNSSEKTIFSATLDSTGSAFHSPVFLWTPKTDDNGKYIYAKITYSGHTRYHYLGKPFTVTATEPAPTISSVSPSTLTGLPLPQTQRIQIIGSGFTSSSTLTFNDGYQSYESIPARLTFVNANELDYLIAVGVNAATWTVKVLNGGQESNFGNFSVVSPSSAINLSCSVSPASGSPGFPLTVSGNANYNNNGGAVPVATVTITIGGQNYTAAVNNGSYSRIIYAPSSPGNYTVSVFVSDGIGKTGSTSSSVTVTSNGSTSGYTINGYLTCKSADSADPWMYHDAIDAFGSDDSRFYVWLEMTDITGVHTLYMRLYRPDGTLYNQTDTATFGENVSHYDWWRGWWYWQISGYDIADLEGRWTVKLYVDGSYKQTINFTLRYAFKEHLLCKDHQTSDPFSPINPTSIFTQTDTKAETWCNLDKVSNPLEIKWQWYEPNGSLYVESAYNSTDPNLQGYDYWEWSKFWGNIGIQGNSAANKCGDWYVDVFIKDAFGNWDKEYTDYFRILEAPLQPPTCAVSATPANPIAGETITLNVSATDNTYLKNVVVHWRDASEHTNPWNNLFAPSLNQNLPIGSIAAGQQIEYWVVASDTSGNLTESIHQIVTVPPTLLPVVTATSPADGAIGVSVNTTITATFSEAMDASTISGSTFTINNGVTGTVTYDDTTQTATFTPSENLNYLTKYTATITKDVKDVAGNPMTDDYSWSFTTVPEPTPTPTPTPTVTEVAPKVSGGHWHTVALKSDGTVWTWGHNFDGELGDGTTNTRYLPAQVDGLNNVIAVGAGNYHTIALKSDGTIWIWGHNGSGELGDGTITNRTTPIQVSGLSGVSAIAGGVFHTIALKLDGTVWTWGANWVGQLGDGTTIDKSTPVQVSGLSDIIAIDGAYHHTAALKSDGTVWTWGANDYGQLGDGTNTNRTTPVQVNGLSDVTAIACGDDHTIALKSDGTVWAWGHNDDGQLGDETTNDRPTPVQVSGLSGVTAIAAGDDHTVVLKSDGTVWAWGNNGDGQLGDMTTTNRTAPVQVNGLSDIITIGAGNYHTIAMQADGTVWTWGANNAGQLGDGTNTNENTPVLANINLIQTVTPTPNQTPTGIPIPTVGPTPLPTPSPTPTSVVTPTPSPTLTATPPPIPTPIPGNIEFHYTFDEGVGTVAHDSASSNDGTINGATWTTGKDGSGLSFNGNDDSVQIPGFMGQPQNITISAWAKLNSNDINGAEVISLGDHVALRLDGTGSKGVMGFYYDGTTWRITTTGISYAGTGWHHFVYVMDDANTMQKIYVDGVEKSSTAHTQPISYAGLGANTLIGKHGNGSGNYDFNGIIDDVCIYNRALNAQEVLALYDQLPAQATAPYARSSMTIDGNLTESSWDITTDVSNVVIGTANNTVKFGVLWDSTYLYVGMTVLDDTLHNNSTYVHEDDSVEIYIDGDHNHGTTYDSYDRQCLKGWFDSTLVEQHSKTAGVLHGWAPISGGYSIELAIPWNNLGITPAAGMTLGFSVGYNDDDNGAGRDGQAVWIGTANNWLDTSVFGDILLEVASPPTPTPTSTSTPPSPTPTPTTSPTPIAKPLLTPTPTLLSGGLDALYALDEGKGIGTIANDSSGKWESWSRQRGHKENRKR